MSMVCLTVNSKEFDTYIVMSIVGLVPVLFSAFLNKVNFVLLYLFSALISIVLFPLGTVIGGCSIYFLMKYRKAIQQGI